MQLSFGSDFSFKAISAVDFTLDSFPLILSEDYSAQDRTAVETESLGDFSNFVSLLNGGGQSHLLFELNYNGELNDPEFNGMDAGETYSLYNPIAFSISDSLPRYVVYSIWGDRNNTDEDTYTRLIRLPLNTGLSTAGRTFTDAGGQGDLPISHSLQVDAGGQRVFVGVGGSGNLGLRSFEIKATTYEVKRSNNFSDRELQDFGYDGKKAQQLVLETKNLIFYLLGHAADRFVIAFKTKSEIDGEGSENTTIKYDSGILTANAKLGFTGYIADDDALYYNSNGTFYRDSLKGSVVAVATYSGYYFTQMHVDTESDRVILLGGQRADGATDFLPAEDEVQASVYITDLTFSNLTEIGTIKSSLVGNRGIVRLPASNLFMFNGCTIDLLYDADANALVASSNKLVDNSGVLSNGWQLSGLFVGNTNQRIALATLRETTDYLDFSNTIPIRFFSLTLRQ